MCFCYQRSLAPAYNEWWSNIGGAMLYGDKDTKLWLQWSPVQGSSNKPFPCSDGNTTSSLSSWSPPPIRKIKCNADAAVPLNRLGVGLGWALRDDHGLFLHAAMSFKEGWVVEALVARETLSLQHVILETIALLLIDAISSPTMDCLYFCLIV